MSFGSGKSDYLAQWERDRQAIAVNMRPDGQLVLMSRKSRLTEATHGDMDETVTCNVFHIDDPEEERKLAHEIQGWEMEQGWA